MLRCVAAGPSAEELAMGQISQIFSMLHADAWQLSNWRCWHTWATVRNDEENPIDRISNSSHTFSAEVNYFHLREKQNLSVWFWFFFLSAQGWKIVHRKNKTCRQITEQTWRFSPHHPQTVTSVLQFPTRVTHSDLTSCSFHLLLLGWSLKWYHWHSHQLLPLALRTWWCNPGIEGFTDRALMI